MDRTNLLVYRLVTGKDIFNYKNSKIEYIPPCIDLLYEAEIFYSEYVNNIKFDGYILQEDVHKNVILKGFATPEEKREFDELDKTIDNERKLLYEAWTNKKPMEIKMKRAKIRALGDRYMALYNIFHCLDNVVLEVCAREEADLYWFRKSIKVNGDYQEELDRSILNAVKSRFISSEEYRKVARDNTWMSYYNIGVFNNKIINQEQLNAISVTKTFLNVYSHPECPVDEVLDDYDLFQGWIYYIREKNEISKQKAEIDTNTKPNSMVFVPVKDGEEAKKVNKMNSGVGKILAASLINKGKENAAK
jgi:hypothetical protein